MRKRFLSLLIAALLLCPALAQTVAPEDMARDFLTMLAEGRYEEAFAASDATMQGALGKPESFKTVWAQLEQYGAFKGILSIETQQSEGYTTALIVCDFTAVDITLQTAFDAQGLCAGLVVTAAEPKQVQTEQSAPTETLLLREGQADQTEATFTVPEGIDRFPAAVLLQGSGPSDKDESAYGIAPFRDLADGLATLGIATVRYDKYTYAHADLLQGDALATFTVEEEYFSDLQAAVALLEADERVTEIWIIGHSQGAMLAPRLMAALDSEKLAGGVLLCGTPKHLWEIQLSQYTDIIARLSGADAQTTQAYVDAETAKAEQLAEMAEETLLSETLFGITAYYQQDEISIDAAETAIQNDLPLLIVQGGKDWQVTVANGIDAWREALDGWTGATYIEYADMNHMLCEMEGEPAGDTTDYVGMTGVLYTLIEDIAGFILGR